MVISFRFKTILAFTAVVILYKASCVRAENYEWLRSPEYESIFVLTDLEECDVISDKLNETVKKTFARSNIKATISNSLLFHTTDESGIPIFEFLDDEVLYDELIRNDKIILHIYGKCVKYYSGFIYHFDIHFGVNNKKYSQALLYSTPRHSVVGVDSIVAIDRSFRELMQNVVDDYWSANQPRK